jgi:RNA polymerase sigma factor (sigma-70 family)
VYDLPETVNRKIDQVIESSLDDSEKQQLCKRLNDVLNNWMQNSRPSHLMQKHLPEYMYKPSCNRILVYISSVEYATDRQQFIDSTLHEIFPGKTIKSYVYTYKTSEAPLHDFLAEDDTTYIKVLYSIDKIMETIHIDDLRILIMMRPSVSNRIITQQFGRVNSIANQNKPLILDMVDNLSVLNQKTLRDTERIPRKAPTPKTHTNILVPTLTFYSNLFQSIDAAIKRAKYYTYHGFTGTLKEMCYVFDADYDEARNMLDTHNIEDVMDSLSCSADYAENAVPRHVKSDEDIALTSEQKEYAERNMHLVDNFIRNHNIEDEDMQQNLYLCYLQRVISTADHAFPYPAIRRMFVINAVRAKYLGLYRQSVKTSYQTVPWDEYTANDINTGTHSEITLAQISDAIDQVMSNLQPRQRKVLSLRFGFTDGTEWTYAKIGKEMHCTGGRISQIAAKALRKLRHPSSIRYLRDFLDVFDQ